MLKTLAALLTSLACSSALGETLLLGLPAGGASQDLIREVGSMFSNACPQVQIKFIEEPSSRSIFNTVEGRNDGQFLRTKIFQSEVPMAKDLIMVPSIVVSAGLYLVSNKAKPITSLAQLDASKTIAKLRAIPIIKATIGAKPKFTDVSDEESGVQMVRSKRVDASSATIYALLRIFAKNPELAKELYLIKVGNMESYTFLNKNRAQMLPVLEQCYKSARPKFENILNSQAKLLGIPSS